MNLELLEEIHNLEKDGLSYSDISSSLGMTKSNLLICLRMEYIISKKFENLINENKILKDTLQEKDKVIKSLKSVQVDELKKEIDFLNEEIESKRRLALVNEKLATKYENLPNIVKRWF